MILVGPGSVAKILIEEPFVYINHRVCIGCCKWFRDHVDDLIEIFRNAIVSFSTFLPAECLPGQTSCLPIISVS